MACVLCHLEEAEWWQWEECLSVPGDRKNVEKHRATYHKGHYEDLCTKVTNMYQGKEWCGQINKWTEISSGSTYDIRIGKDAGKGNTMAEAGQAGREVHYYLYRELWRYQWKYEKNSSPLGSMQFNSFLLVQWTIWLFGGGPFMHHLHVHVHVLPPSKWTKILYIPVELSTALPASDRKPEQAFPTWMWWRPTKRYLPMKEPPGDLLLLSNGTKDLSWSCNRPAVERQTK